MKGSFPAARIYIYRRGEKERWRYFSDNIINGKINYNYNKDR
jgi:hypothetical protein